MNAASVVTFNANVWDVLAFASGTVLPLIVGLVTTKVTSPGVKSVLLLALSIIASGLAQVLQTHQNGQSFDLWNWLLTALATFIVGVSSHFGLWRPTGVADKILSVGRKAKAA